MENGQQSAVKILQVNRLLLFANFYLEKIQVSLQTEAKERRIRLYNA